MHANFAYMFDTCANLVVHLLMLKSSMNSIGMPTVSTNKHALFNSDKYLTYHVY